MSNTKKQKISILYANYKVVKKFLKSLDGDENFSWIYLGKNVPFSHSLNQLLGDRHKRFEIADFLQVIAIETRQEYIDYIGKLGAEEKSKFWWLTSVSEKNLFISNVFLYFCYVKVILKVLKKTPQDYLIICDSFALMETLNRNLKRNEELIVIYEKSGLHSIFFSIKNHFSGLINTAYFLFRWLCRCVLSHIFRLTRIKNKRFQQPKGKKIFIHSWADYRSFRTPGLYDDVFLGRLGTDLKKIHPDINYLVDVLPTCFFPIALLKLRKIEDNFLLMEEFLHPLDIISSVYLVTVNSPIISKIPQYMNLDVAPIIHEELKNDRSNSRAFQTYLCYIIGKKLACNHEVQSFIYSFENLMWEKMFCYAFKEYSPQTAIIAYAHSTISKMETFYSVSRYENQFIPLPDMIVVNGIRARNVLINSGFSPDAVTIGGAFRYHTLKKRPYCGVVQGLKKILIIPTDDINSTLELVYKSILAFGEREGISCIIKFHPTLPRRKILQYLSQMPDNFIISEDPIIDLLSGVDMVVYTGSTVSVEALAQGIPILHVRSDLIIDRDFYEPEDQIKSVSRPQEMYQAFMEFSGYSQIIKERGEKIVNEFFAPVQEESLTIFLGKIH